MSAIPFDASEPVRFQPEPTGPTYLLRVPRKRDKGPFLAAVTAAGGASWSRVQLMLKLEEAIGDLLPGDDDYEAREARKGEVAAYRLGIESAVELWRAEKSEEADKLLGEALAMPPRVIEIHELVRRSGHPGYGGMLGDLEGYPTILGTVAAERFLVGWEGGDLPPFRRTSLGVSGDLLEEVPDRDLVAIGYEVARLMDPEKRRLGNSASASSGASPRTSSGNGTDTPSSDPEPSTPSA